MRRTLALMLVVGLSVRIAKADEKQAPPPKLSTVTPEDDWRLAKQPGAPSQKIVLTYYDKPPEKDARLAKRGDAPPKKIGILSYYPNKGGGFTFREGADIVFYALPYTPNTREVEKTVLVSETTPSGKVIRHRINQWQTEFAIGPSEMPFGGLTVYRSEMFNGKDGLCREDTPIAKWTRDTPDGKFHLSIMADDSETRLKLKSIVPVLERGEHGR